MEKEFIQKISDLSGQNIMSCYQCGKCSGGCPGALFMDILPNQVIRLIQLSDESVLNCKTIWICASCFTCFIRCPKGIDLAKVMESLRQIQLRKNVDYVELRKLSKEEIMELPTIALVSNFRKFTG